MTTLRRTIRFGPTTTRLWAALALGGVALMPSLRVAEASSLELVAMEGMRAAGLPAGVTYDGFSAPAINNRGRVAFSGSLEGAGVEESNSAGFWRQDNAGLHLIARRGDDAPGAGGAVFGGNAGLRGFPRFIRLSDTGKIAFFAGLDGTRARLGVWLSDADALDVIAMDLTPAPGVEPTAGFDWTRDSGLFSPLSASRSDTIVLSATLDDGNAYTWRSRIGSPQELELIPRASLDLSEFEDGLLRNANAVTLSSAGLVGFVGKVLPAGESNSVSVAWTAEPEGSRIIAYEGQPAADAIQGNYRVFQRLGIDANGDASFLGFLERSARVTVLGRTTFQLDSGVWKEVDGELRGTMVAGMPASGFEDGIAYRDFYDAAFSSGGDAFAYGRVYGEDPDYPNPFALWQGRPGDVRLVARQGDAAPGQQDGAALATFRDLQINGSGQVLFVTELEGPGVDEGNDRMLVGTDIYGTLTPIVREGDFIATPFGTKQVRSFLVGGTAGDDSGLPRSINDLGQVTFSVQFTDFTDAVFLSSAILVPEPSAAMMIALLTPLASGRRAQSAGLHSQASVFAGPESRNAVSAADSTERG